VWIDHAGHLAGARCEFNALFDLFAELTVGSHRSNAGALETTREITCSLFDRSRQLVGGDCVHDSTAMRNLST